jgi:hypothetical protein
MMLAAKKTRDKSRVTVPLSWNVTQEGGIEGGIPQPGHTTEAQHRKRQQILRSRISKVLKTISFFLLCYLYFQRKLKDVFCVNMYAMILKREISKTLFSYAAASNTLLSQKHFAMMLHFVRFFARGGGGAGRARRGGRRGGGLRER